MKTRRSAPSNALLCSGREYSATPARRCPDSPPGFCPVLLAISLPPNRFRRRSRTQGCEVLFVPSKPDDAARTRDPNSAFAHRSAL